MWKIQLSSLFQEQYVYRHLWQVPEQLESKRICPQILVAHEVTLFLDLDEVAVE